MSSLLLAARRTDEDVEYARLMRDIRFSEFEEACRRSRTLQEIAAELRSTARRLLQESANLRRPADGRHAPCAGGGR